MRDFTYPVRLEAEADGGFVVHVRDFGGATQARDRAAALQAAEDYIGTWIDMLVEMGRDVPVPSDAEPGELLVAAPIDAATVALLHQALREHSVTRVELARRMGKDEKEVRRMLDPRHGTKLATFRAAFRALGVRPEIRAA
jgi:antitoxin HicB